MRALLEGIACQFALTLDLLRRNGIEPHLVRATGGGAKSAWWLQLKADLTGVPVEVVAQDEPGAFGAAILAGVGAGVYESVSSAVDRLVVVADGSSPTRRAALYADVRAGSRGGGLTREHGDAHDRARRRVPPFSTPALIVDLDVFEANVAAMEQLLRGTGKTVRPHVKTHRTPELARRQLGGSAVGVTCATVGEAEVMVAAGIDDVLVANEVVDPAKIARLVALADAARDRRRRRRPGAGGAALARRRGAGVTVDVLIDVDIGLHRCGVASAAEAVALAAVIERLPGLRLGGLMGYEGRVRLSVEDRDAKIAGAYATLAEVRAALLAAGSRSTSCPRPARRRSARRWPTRRSPSSRPASTR